MEEVRKIAQRFAITKKIEDATQGRVKPEHSLIAIVILCIILTLSTPLGPLLTSTIGIIVPLRQTLTILKQDHPKKEQLRHFVIFWLFFGILTALDAYTSFVVSFIPLFYTFKLVFLLYIGPLKFMASDLLYDKVLANIPEKLYESERMEEFLARAGKIVVDKAQEAKKVGEELQKEKIPRKSE